MKCFMLTVVMLAIGLLSVQFVRADEPAAGDTSEWQALLGDAPGAGGVGRQAAGTPPGAGFGFGGRRLAQADHPPGPAGQPASRGPGARAGRGPMGPGMAGRHAGWQKPLEPEQVEQLLQFLAEHEPALAALLKQLQTENPEKFQRRLPMLTGLYGPIMRQMQRQPEMAKLSLKQIRLKLRVQQTVRDAKSAPEDEQPAARQELKERLGAMFDVVIEKEERRLSRWDELKENVEEWRELLGETDKGKAQVDPPRRGRGRRSDKDVSEAPQDARRSRRQRAGFGEGHLKQRFEQSRESLEHWRANREKIIDTRLEQLLSRIKPFPWGR